MQTKFLDRRGGIPRRWRRLTIAALWAAASVLAIVPTTQAAGLLVADGGFGGVLEIVDHEVDVTINNGIAVTRVTQVFRNTEQRQVEALYTFPVPEAASVANFSMWIDGKEMVGEVVEKERARQIYESYKQTRRDPGLLEQVDYKTFEMRIFPIGPGAEQRVQIAYYQELDFDSDWATYVYPLATTTRSALDSRTRGRFALNVDIASEVPIVEVESPSHAPALALATHAPGRAQASLETANGDLSRDVVLSYRVSRPRSGFDLIATKPPNEDGYVMLTLTAGDELGAPGEGMDYVFVLDVSGSMNQDGKFGLSRGSVGAFIDALGPGDRFEVLTFNVAAAGLFSDLRATGDASRADAAAFLATRVAKGGTFLEPAIRSAYGYKDPDRALNVVILSDGLTEQRERQTLLRLMGERPGGARVFAIGVGNDVNRPLLDQLAKDAGGLSAFISRGDDFGRQAQAFRRKLMRPAATNLILETADGVLYDVEPRTLPGLYHGAPLRIYARYLGAGPLRLTLRGDLGGEPFQRSVTLELPGDTAQSPEIERMWAFKRVQRLLEDADRAGDRAAFADEIVRLGEGYSIVTEYTSFLVLENDAEYRRWKVDRRNATRIQRDRKQQDAVRAELEALRNLSASRVGPPPRESGGREDAAPPASIRPAVAHPPPPAAATERGGDLDLGGGGALDPLGVALVLTLGGAAAASLRRRDDA